MSSKNFLSSFGRRLRNLRDEKGLSQEKLAEICGLDRTYISSVERGKRNISLKNIEVLAESLKISPASFFDDR